MNRFLSVTLKFLTAVVLAAGVLGPGAAQAAPQKISCTFNLKNNTNTCAGVPGITAITRTANAALALPGAAAASTTQLLLRVNVPSGKTATFTVRYDSVPSGWTVNIGDSRTNNGFGGDAGTQSNDAEMQVVGQSMTVYGKDGTPVQPLSDVGNVGLGPGSVATFDVSNETLCWDLPNTGGCAISSYLYALNGQADSEGPINYDVWAGFNRVISGPGSRIGSGVASVTVVVQ